MKKTFVFEIKKRPDTVSRRYEIREDGKYLNFEEKLGYAVQTILEEYCENVRQWTLEWDEEIKIGRLGVWGDRR